MPIAESNAVTHLIFGCGYLGQRVARRWRDQGKLVAVVTRSEERALTLVTEGYLPIIADVTQPESLAFIPQAECVLFAVGHDRQAGPTIEEVYVEGLRRVLDVLSTDTQRFIYISSTGVYGDSTSNTSGELIDENSLCVPTRPGGKACLAAERLLAEHRLGSRSVVLRLAGIYGPDRIPLAAPLARGEPIDVSPDGYLNLIHVDDAAEVVLAAEERAALPRTFCVSDGEPVERREYYTHLARLMGAPPPTFAAPVPTNTASDSPRMARSGSKRIANARMMTELRPALAYPSYREGLASAVEIRSQ